MFLNKCNKPTFDGERAGAAFSVRGEFSKVSVATAVGFAIIGFIGM
eukprot:gene26219-1056_t